MAEHMLVYTCMRMHGPLVPAHPAPLCLGEGLQGVQPVLEGRVRLEAIVAADGLQKA